MDEPVRSRHRPATGPGGLTSPDQVTAPPRPTRPPSQPLGNDLWTSRRPVSGETTTPTRSGQITVCTHRQENDQQNSGGGSRLKLLLESICLSAGDEEGPAEIIP